MHQVDTQREAQLVFAFRAISSEQQKEMAVAFMRRFAGIAGGLDTRMIICTDDDDEVSD